MFDKPSRKALRISHYDLRRGAFGLPEIVESLFRRKITKGEIINQPSWVSLSDESLLKLVKQIVNKEL